MATKDCIDFIETQNITGLAKDLKWKRVSKKKDEHKNEIRTFKSNLGDEVIVKEDTSGSFSIESVVLAQSSSKFDKWLENKIKILNLVESSMPVVFKHGELKYMKRHGCDLSELDERVKSELDYFCKSVKELKKEFSGNELLNCIIYELIGNIYEMQKDGELEGKFHKPIEIEVSSENLEVKIGYLPMDSKKNYQVIVGCFSGDWEHFVEFALYWDVEHNLPRIHIPEEPFNKYNRKFMCAYGSEEAIASERNIELTKKDRSEIDAVFRRYSDGHNSTKTLESLQSYLLKVVN